MTGSIQFFDAEQAAPIAVTGLPDGQPAVGVDVPSGAVRIVVTAQRPPPPPKPVPPPLPTSAEGMLMAVASAAPERLVSRVVRFSLTGRETEEEVKAMMDAVADWIGGWEMSEVAAWLTLLEHV